MVDDFLSAPHQHHHRHLLYLNRLHPAFGKKLPPCSSLLSPYRSPPGLACLALSSPRSTSSFCLILQLTSSIAILCNPGSSDLNSLLTLWSRARSRIPILDFPLSQSIQIASTSLTQNGIYALFFPPATATCHLAPFCEGILPEADWEPFPGAPQCQFRCWDTNANRLCELTG